MCSTSRKEVDINLLLCASEMSVTDIVSLMCTLTLSASAMLGRDRIYRRPRATGGASDSPPSPSYRRKRSVPDYQPPPPAPPPPPLPHASFPVGKRIKLGWPSPDSPRYNQPPARSLSRSLRDKSPSARNSASFTSNDSLIDDKGDPEVMSRPFGMRPVPRSASVQSVDHGRMGKKGHFQKFVESAPGEPVDIPDEDWNAISDRLNRQMRESRAAAAAAADADDAGPSSSAAVASLLGHSDSDADVDNEPDYSSQDDADEVVCDVCKSGVNEESLLLCDGCDFPCHTYCLPTPLSSVPDGDWFCDECVAKRRRP